MASESFPVVAFFLAVFFAVAVLAAVFFATVFLLDTFFLDELLSAEVDKVIFSVKSLLGVCTSGVLL